MLKSFINVSEEESKEIEKWLQQYYNNPDNQPIDILLMILYKLHLLEQKINVI